MHDMGWAAVLWPESEPSLDPLDPDMYPAEPTPFDDIYEVIHGEVVITYEEQPSCGSNSGAYGLVATTGSSASIVILFVSLLF
jgi:hypothetical protein